MYPLLNDLWSQSHQTSTVLEASASRKMITRYITNVSTAFSPFNARSGKTVRNFLALLPPNARSTMKIDVKMFGQKEAEKPASLGLKFSMCETG